MYASPGRSPGRSSQSRSAKAMPLTSGQLLSMRSPLHLARLEPKGSIRSWLAAIPSGVAGAVHAPIKHPWFCPSRAGAGISHSGRLLALNRSSATFGTVYIREREPNSPRRFPWPSGTCSKTNCCDRPRRSETSRFPPRPPSQTLLTMVPSSPSPSAAAALRKSTRRASPKRLPLTESGASWECTMPP